MRRGAPDSHETIRVRIRQRAEQKRIQHTEHRGVDADAESECQHRDDREPFVLSQHAQAIANILGYAGHTFPPFVYESSRFRVLDDGSLLEHLTSDSCDKKLSLILLKCGGGCYCDERDFVPARGRIFV